ncbi:MAG: proton-conducting transporter membrane subunit, partial [Planctomycetota bacterium]
MLEFVYSHVSLQALMWLVVGFPLAGAAISGLLALATARSEGPRFVFAGALAGTLFPALSLAACAALFVTLSGLESGAHAAITGPLFRFAALPELVVDVGLRMDELSLVLSLTVAAVGFLVHVYSVGFMQGDEGVLRYFSLLGLFLFFMQLLVLADNLVLLFVGWEGVGLCSWLLISFWYGEEWRARAGTKAFVLNALGAGGMLLAMFLVFSVMSAAGASPESGYFNFETMQRHAASFVPVAGVISLALLTGAAAKSAQIPFYVWLPDAMAGPTPVSALIHAATMVAAGVYLVVRLSFVFALSQTALETMAAVGAATALMGAVLALSENDLKKIL